MLLSITSHLKVYYNSVCLSQALLILTVGSFHRVTNQNTGTGLDGIRYSRADGKTLIDKPRVDNEGGVMMHSLMTKKYWGGGGERKLLAFLVILHHQFSRYN